MIGSHASLYVFHFIEIVLAAFVDRKCVHDASVSGWLIAPVIVFLYYITGYQKNQ